MIPPHAFPSATAIAEEHAKWKLPSARMPEEL